MSWKDFRTSVAGVLTIIGGSSMFFAHWAAHGWPGAEHWAVLGSAIATGAGLIAAKDGREHK